MGQRFRSAVCRSDLVENARRGCRPDAGQELDDAKARYAVTQILRPAQESQYVLDMRGFEEFQAAEFDEGNVAPGQFDLERSAVVRGSEQHRLLLQCDSSFAMVQDALRHVARLVG